MQRQWPSDPTWSLPERETLPRRVRGGERRPRTPRARPLRGRSRQRPRARRRQAPSGRRGPKPAAPREEAGAGRRPGSRAGGARAGPQQHGPPRRAGRWAPGRPGLRRRPCGRERGRRPAWAPGRGGRAGARAAAGNPAAGPGGGELRLRRCRPGAGRAPRALPAGASGAGRPGSALAAAACGEALGVLRSAFHRPGPPPSRASASRGRAGPLLLGAGPGAAGPGPPCAAPWLHSSKGSPPIRAGGRKPRWRPAGRRGEAALARVEIDPPAGGAGDGPSSSPRPVGVCHFPRLLSSASTCWSRFHAASPQPVSVFAFPRFLASVRGMSVRLSPSPQPVGVLPRFLSAAFPWLPPSS